jgi:hypothetical protein
VRDLNSLRRNEIWDLITAKEKELLGVKSGEYALNDDEILFNFKEGAKLMDKTSLFAAWSYFTKHLIAIQKAVIIGKFMFKWAIKQPDGTYTEGIIQKIVDARNYLFLMLCCMEDETGIEVKVGMDE